MPCARSRGPRTRHLDLRRGLQAPGEPLAALAELPGPAPRAGAGEPFACERPRRRRGGAGGVAAAVAVAAAIREAHERAHAAGEGAEMTYD